ncbi:hypothetical protein OK016_02520 [Vibrio chagasii]|nr:hypothetical protein [Vibrio chagasii]
MVINGWPAAASVRIHNAENANGCIRYPRYRRERATREVRFLLDALQYGTPPHRWSSIRSLTVQQCYFVAENIRDVIAFPKTTALHVRQQTRQA